MKKVKGLAIFLAGIVFILILLKLLKYEIIGSISVLWYTTAILPIWGIFIVTMLVFLILLFCRNWRVAAVMLLLCLVPFTPLDDAYESLRFSALHPLMEAAAVEIAQEYQAVDAKTNIIYNVPLTGDFPHLSRGGTVNVILSEKGIEIAFYKCQGLLEYSEQYIFTTHIPYYGSSAASGDYFSQPQEIRKHKSLDQAWIFVVTG